MNRKKLKKNIKTRGKERKNKMNEKKNTSIYKNKWERKKK